MNNSLKRLIVSLAVIASCSILLGFIYLLYVHYTSYGGNHSVLFGTSLEQYLLQYPFAISMIPGILLLAPATIKNKKKIWLFIILGILAFFFTYWSIGVLTD